jgi:two-component system OmpR family sensor kinase/two-component system sensor histidine kinase BaeS
MNRLSVRLPLLFVAAILLTVFIVAALSDAFVSSDFRRFVAEQIGGEQVGQEGQAPGSMGGMMNRGGGQGRGMMMRAPEQAFLDQLRLTLVAAGLAAGTVGILIGVVFSRSISAPLRRLSLAARDLAARRWERRVEVTGVDEVREVAQAFNTMAEELAHAETLRRNLMADVAHELRTPLTVMQGSLRAILDGVYPLEMKEVASLYDETRLLARLVEDLRELALAEAGAPVLKLQRVELRPLLAQVADRFALAVSTQGVTLNVETSGDPAVLADPDRLEQVLNNLIVNALRHTPEGSISVRCLPASDGVRISVIDTGEGIAPDVLPHLFTRFAGGDAARSRGSTGLGLAIAKTWVEAMGGTIGVDSTVGAGSTFWFVLRPA